MPPPLSRQRRALYLYRLLLWLLAIPLLLLTAWQSLKGRQLRYLRERCGLYRETVGKRPLWLHAASVGEVNALLPLVAVLRCHHPQLPLLVTTTTLTGARTARGKLPADVGHAFLPLDYPAAVRRFLTHFRPRCALVMETELWPHLYGACTGQGVPLLLVNGRLSGRTLRAPKWLRHLYGATLQHVSAILARGESDRAGFIALGADPARCRVVGNIKFAAAPRMEGVVPVELGQRYILAASTREKEEALLLEAWRKSGITDHLLVIAPRHPQRLNEILKVCGGYSVAVRSRGDSLSAGTELYIADTLGELPSLMAGAELVFMGGSLVAKGGQNLLEPAALGKATLFGPHMENFSNEAAILLSEEGAEQVRDGDALATTMRSLLDDRERRERLGARARAAIEARRDIAESYYQALLPLCGESLSS